MKNAITAVWIGVFLFIGLTCAAQKISFYANISTIDALAGHVWVGLDNGSQEVVYGFYPGSLLFNGQVKDETDRLWDVSYSFLVTSEQLQKAQDAMKNFQRTYYIPGKRDCRSFAAMIARAIGLKTPMPGTKSPAEWLGGLVDLN